MRRALIAVVVVVLLAAAGLAAVPVLERHAAGEIKAAIERDGQSRVGQVEVGFLERRVVLAELKLARPDLSGSVGRAEAVGLAWPLGEFLKGRTPFAGWRLGDPFEADRIEVRDLALEAPGGARWSARAVVARDVALSRFDGAYSGPYGGAVLTARALAALSLGRLEIDTLMAALSQSGDTVGAAAITAEQYDRGRLARLVTRSIEATSRESTAPQLRVEQGELQRLDVGRMLVRLSSADWQPGDPPGRLRVDGVSLTGFGGDLLARYGISLGAISLETTHESPEVSRSRTRIEGFVLAPPLRGLQSLQMRIVLQAMGLKELKLDLDCAGDEDRRKAEAGIGPCVLSGPGLGRIEWSARIVQADAPFWRAVDDGDLDALDESRVALGSARLVLRDDSLLERILKALSTMNGRPAEETRRNLAQELRGLQPPDVLITQDLSKLLDAAARFVERGGTLTVEAKPDPPAGLPELQSLLRPGADLVGVLGVTASLAPR